MRNFNLWIVLIVVGLLGILVYAAMQQAETDQISLGYFKNLIRGRDFKGNRILVDGRPIETAVEQVELIGHIARGTLKHDAPAEPRYDPRGREVEPPPGQVLKRKFQVTLMNNPESLRDLEKELTDAGIPVSAADTTGLNQFLNFLLIAFSIGLLLFLFYSFRRSQNQMLGGGGFLNSFSRSPAKRYEPTQKQITFADVAGLEGVKADLQEIVDFLKDPGKFQKLGGRVPKGVLLMGPPGTGKTLLARAIAGEANVPFFSVNGSEFIQMFVGVGASRVRDLFTTAKAQSPAIIFIDEIDAVGRQRGAGLGGGHDEREQTLNQILGEMDGFQKTESVIVVAATNRPDVLDPALLRPGRFDRHITVSRPTMKGRLEIFKVHVRDVPLGPDVDLEVMAQATAGMTGADIQNLVNEAALWAARQNKSKVEMSDLYYAHDKVLMGAKREEVLNQKEKERTAYHEAGHTLSAWSLPGAMPVHKVTVIPRGQALGVTQMVPEEDRMNLSENEIRDTLVVMLSGRAAEKLVYDEFTVGAQNDLERATRMARRMVTEWGMSDRLGPVSYKMTEEDPFLGREMHQSRQFSEHTMEVIDEEVTKILQAASVQALELLDRRRADLDQLASELVKREELDRRDIRVLIGASVHDTESSEKAASEKEAVGKVTAAETLN
ncbi:MAG: ATP-dependent zinc metalloprotease FtsH [Planctomycetota bacterium]|jgi:cell division protease FtsH